MAFVDVGVVPMDTERVLEHQTVLVERGRITVLGPADRVPVPTGATRIDGRGAYLIPGLADMHAHVFWQDGDSAGAERRLLRALAAGVTTLRDPHFAPHPAAEEALTRRQRARLAAGTLLGPRVYMSGPWAGERPGTAADAATAIPAYQALGYDFVKINGEDTVTYDSLLAAARRAGLPVVGHLPAGISVERALRDGWRSIEHLYGSLPYAIEHATDGAEPDTALQTALAALAAATRRAGTWNCPTEADVELIADVAVRTGVDLAASAGEAPETHQRFPPARMVALRRRVIKALYDGGAGLLLGTDARPAPPWADSAVAAMSAQGLPPAVAQIMGGRGFDTLTVADELAALARAGLTPYQALVTGTRNPAAYFGTLAETGTIAVGKRADLVLLAGNPLQDIRHAADVTGVMLGGRWVPRDTIDRRITLINTGQ